MRIGIVVRCCVCGQTKKPVGRDAPMAASYCDDECRGYRQGPLPGSLWPGETEEEFGYPVSRNGTEGHVCRESKTCTCWAGDDAPNEYCPVHGSGEWPRRCGRCGKFMPSRSPVLPAGVE